MLDRQIENAHADRAHVPELCRTLADMSILVIGAWADASGRQLSLQDFNLQGESFIPVFSDRDQFWGQLGMTPFANQGLEIDCRALIGMLDGNEILILNPGSTAPVQLSKADFEPFLRPAAPQATLDSLEVKV